LLATLLIVGEMRDRLRGDANETGPKTPVRATDAGEPRSFAVRQVLRPGEYFQAGGPAIDGRYFTFLDPQGEVAIKDLRTGQVRHAPANRAGDGWPAPRPPQLRRNEVDLHSRLASG